MMRARQLGAHAGDSGNVSGDDARTTATHRRCVRGRRVCHTLSLCPWSASASRAAVVLVAVDARTSMPWPASASSSHHSCRSQDGTTGRAPTAAAAVAVLWRRKEKVIEGEMSAPTAIERAVPLRNGLPKHFSRAMREKACCTAAAQLAFRP